MAAGELACQRESYLRTLTTSVRSCTPVKPNASGKKKTEEEKIRYEVILEDTVLFPEGGGQPDDRGTLNDEAVVRVVRRGGDALHIMDVPFTEGQAVEVKVDWDRRFDHMQQHSGQHLITAVTESLLGFGTTSWSLGCEFSTIELDAKKMSDNDLTLIEDEVNKRIRQQLPINVDCYSSKDDPAFPKARSRALPADHVGSIRIVSIEGLDTNTCCGTHVSNLAHLQSIKILGFEKAKKNKTNISFLAGDRVLKHVDKSLRLNKQLTSLLKGGPDSYIDLVNKVQTSFKVAQKNSTSLLRDIALLEANHFKQNGDGKFLSLHRKEGDLDYMNTIVNEINNTDVVIFLTTGDDKGQGLFTLSGPENFITDNASQVIDYIDGKGAYTQGRYKGRAGRLSKRHKAELHIQNALLTCTR